jgi:hypothetical protein
VSDIISNIELWQRIIQQIAEEIKRRWSRIGHVLRKQPGSITFQTLAWNPPGQEKEWKPKELREVVSCDRHLMGYTWGELETME